MMYGYGSGAWWMMLMPLLWIALIALVAWLVIRLSRPATTGGGTAPRRRPTPREILDRRYASGEIDDATYTSMRSRLADPGTGSL